MTSWKRRSQGAITRRGKERAHDAGHHGGLRRGLMGLLLPASLEEWDSQVWPLLLEKGTVNRDGSVAFEFRNGKEIKVEAK